MANKLITKWCMLSNITIMVILFSSLLHWVEAQPRTPCFFIFGDSVVDNGNNNDLDTTAKCNYPPYGLDFPTGQPTGRFCNGRTIVDITAELLGLSNYMPPFADTSGADILLGVNYASAGAGIRYETGKNLGEILSFDEQLENHQTIISQMNDIIGSSESTFEYLNKCLYYLGMGGNDYMNNYLLTKNYTYTPEEFADLLIQQYSDQLESLYESGARKFALYSVGAAGCIPYVIGTSGTDGSLCSELYNSPIRIFNEKLKSLVDELNDNFNDAHFIYVNIYDLTFELVEDPSSFDTSCCGNGNKNSAPCQPLQIPCPNRDEYLYWDPYHLSEAANEIITQRTYHAQTETDTYPMDIFTLAQL